MTTALQLINGAASKLGVKSAEEPLEAEDFQVILDELNDLGSEWADIGLTPTFAEVSSADDLVSIDRNAVAAFKNTLAVRAAPTFDKIVSPALSAITAQTLQTLQASTTYIGDVAFPDTLPAGSGSDCSNYYYDDQFFPENKKVNF